VTPRVYSLIAFLIASVVLIPSISRAQDLLVSVRERSGEPLATEAFVHIISQASEVIAVTTTGSARTAVGAATFDVDPGDYEIEVEAVGYNKGSEHATITSRGRTVTVYVFLTRVGDSTATAPASGVVVAPRVQRELDESLAALRRNKFGEARKHLEKAQKMAPSNPDVLYLIGLLDYMEKNTSAARKQFESVLAAYPAHARSLLMLGQMHLESQENKEASATLQKAVDVDPNNWQAHYLFGVALIRTGELTKAEAEVARAGNLNKDKAGAMKLLGARILMAQRKNSEAKSALQAYIKDYPTDPGIPEAKKYIEKIEEAEKAAATSALNASQSQPAPTVDSFVASVATIWKPWAPLDVDAAIPPTASDVSCSAENVLQNTQQRIGAQLADLEKFRATERVEHQVLDPTGAWTLPVSKDFDYLIFVHTTPKYAYSFDESRNGAESLDAFPSSLATRGLATLAFLVVHPLLSKDLQFACEGLGSWNGRPAWQLHFVQKQNVRSRVRLWNYKDVVYPIPLKGRLWIAANDYNIVRLETALREPVSGLMLNREQLAVDYGPVGFQSSKTSLWLPMQAEMYFELRGHRYHHRHMLTGYQLFEVNTLDKIKHLPVPDTPKEN